MTADLRHLRAFLQVADAGTITAAATRMHMTQPAVSRLLAQLEAHLGVRLVERSTHHLTLTGVGAAYRDRAAAAVATVDTVLDPTTAGSWPLRLGHAWSALGARTPALLRRWAELHPDVELQLLQVDHRSAGLQDGRVDAAVIRGRVSGPGLRSRHVYDEVRIAAIPTGHPLAHRAQLTLDDLADEPLVVNTVSGTTGTALWPPDRRPHRVVKVSTTEDWLAAIAAGRGVGVTVSTVAELNSYPGVRFVPLTDAPPVRVWVAWTDPPTHPAVDALVRLTQQLTVPEPGN